MSKRDFDYENNNSINNYDNGSEIGIKCKNFNLCKNYIPDWWFDCKGTYLCTNCDGIFGIELNFREIDEECPICLEKSKYQAQFPSCPHWFCTKCLKKLFFWNELRYHISPIPYGCPPCPNGCSNPVRGKQCGCLEYDPIIEQWSKEFPKKFEEWNKNEHSSIFMGETGPSSFYSKTCPICRKKHNI